MTEAAAATPPAVEATPAPSPPPAPAAAATPSPSRWRSRTADLADVMAELGVDPNGPIDMSDSGTGPQEDAAPEQEAASAAAEAVAAPALVTDPDAPPADPDAANRMIAQRWAESARRERMTKERERRSLDMASRAERFEAARARWQDDPTAVLEAGGVDPHTFAQRLIEQRLGQPPEPLDPMQEAIARAVAPFKEQLAAYEQQRVQETQQREQQADVARFHMIARQRIAPMITPETAEALFTEFGGSAAAGDNVAAEIVEYHRVTGVLLTPDQAIKSLDRHYEKLQADRLEQLRATKRHAARFAPAPPIVAKPAAKPAPLTNGAGAGPVPPAAKDPARCAPRGRGAEMAALLDEIGVDPNASLA